MKNEFRAEAFSTLKRAQRDLAKLGTTTEATVARLAALFRSFAAQSESISNEAQTVVTRVQGVNLADAAENVESLCQLAQSLRERTLHAATTILDTFNQEEKLLNELKQIMSEQEEIALRLKALSVFTRVESAYLGSAGGDFDLLAQELVEFSQSVLKQTDQMTRHTKNRKLEVTGTAAELAIELPKLQVEMSRTESNIRRVMESISGGLTEFASIPDQFSANIEEAKRQVAGVVAAIQSHDITHQQLEHVKQALSLIGNHFDPTGASLDAQEAEVYAGLLVQVSQLTTIRQAISSWMSQIATCMSNIERLSAAELAGISPLVLDRERKLAGQIDQFDSLHEKSKSYGEKIRVAGEELSSMSELVKEHLEAGRGIRNRLLLLTYNSLIEATRLGAQGAVVSSIALQIKAVSTEWDLITRKTAAVMEKIPALLQRANEAMFAFSDESMTAFIGEQQKTRAALDELRQMAGFVEQAARRMQASTEAMQVTARNREDKLEPCLQMLDSASSCLGGLMQRMKNEGLNTSNQYDEGYVRQLLSPLYTTEIERDVMSAVFAGGPLPVVQQQLEGNEVELF